MKPSLSILIAYHNEGLSSIKEAVSSIKTTIDIDDYEIIVADDYSRTPLALDEDRVKVVRLPEHGGVGKAFTLALQHANSDNIWIQGGDIRYAKNGWASKSIEVIDQNPKSITSGKCIGMNMENDNGMDFEFRRKRGWRNNATIIFYHDHISHPKKPKDFRNITEAQWLGKMDTDEVIEVPCVLGAAYAIKREWLEYINPWKLHASYGSLEPMISLASWLCGGNCLYLPHVETGHIFKRTSSHGTPPSHLVYNKLLLVNLLFPDELRDKLVSFLGININIVKARQLFDTEKIAIFAEREVYKKKITYDVYDYCKRFQINLRDG